MATAARARVIWLSPLVEMAGLAAVAACSVMEVTAETADMYRVPAETVVPAEAAAMAATLVQVVRAAPVVFLVAVTVAVFNSPTPVATVVTAEGEPLVSAEYEADDA